MNLLIQRLSVGTILACLLISWASPETATAQTLAVYGDSVFPVSAPAIKDGVVLIEAGKIRAVGRRDEIAVPQDCEKLQARVVVPGLIDAHSAVGLTGILNQDEDQDQFEHSQPVQPQLRAIDAYNTHDELIAWVRSFGVTTVHTGHAPGELVSGQTMIVKTVGNSVEDALVQPATAIAVTLQTTAQKSGTKPPGTRAKMIAMLRAELIAAKEYQQQVQRAETAGESLPPVDLAKAAWVDVLTGKKRLMITADRAQDISNALRLASEFKLRIWLDSAAESYMLIDEIKAAGASVIIHPTMARPVDDRENLSFETAAKLTEAGIPVAMQSGYERYVPKTRVVLFEAAMAAANGLGFENALRCVTLEAAELLGIQERVGSLTVGKDADLALFDGDPFEYTTHCVGVVIDGKVVSQQAR